MRRRDDVQLRLEGMAANVGLKSGLDTFFVILEKIADLCYLLLAEGDRLCLACEEGAASSVADLCQE